MINAKITATSSIKLGNKYLTQDLIKKAFSNRDPQELEKKIGVCSRYWIDSDESTASVGARVLTEALNKIQLSKNDLGRIIFVNSFGGDCLVPGTGNTILDIMDIPDTCDTFDLNNACMGFLTALDVASKCIVFDLKPVAIVNVEIISRFIDISNPRPYLVFGDGAVATIVEKSDSDAGIIGSYFGNNGKERRSVCLDYAKKPGEMALVQFNDTSEGIGLRAVAALKLSVDKVLNQTGIHKDDINWVVPHQPNGNFYNMIIDALRIPSQKYTKIVDEFGSLGSAAIPLGLDRLLDSKKVKKGDLILLTGVGAGSSFGSVLYKV